MIRLWGICKHSDDQDLVLDILGMALEESKQYDILAK